MSFKNYLRQLAIIGLVETWAKEGEDFDLTGYKSFSVLRPKKSVRGRYSGGILVYIKENLAKITKKT